MLKLVICCICFFTSIICTTAQSNLSKIIKVAKEDSTFSVLEPNDTDKYGIFEFETLDKSEILKKLFDNPHIDSSGVAVWEGNYSDYSQMLQFLSDDKKFHTSLDTILYFNNTKKEKSAVVVFSTWTYEKDFLSGVLAKESGHYVSTPIGIAVFAKSNDKWVLYDFKKYLINIGSNGDYKSSGATLSLSKLANNWTCLRINHGESGGMGTYSGGETLYSIEREDLNGNIVPTLEAIFSYVYEFGDNGLKGGLKLKTIPQTKSYSHLQTTIAGLTITYKYYPEYDKFIQIGVIKEIK